MSEGTQSNETAAHQPCDSGCQPDWHKDGCAIYLPAEPATEQGTVCTEHPFANALLEACESATCPCGHEALDHTWIGCENCVCKRSGIHAVLDSDSVDVSLRPEQRTD